MAMSSLFRRLVAALALVLIASVAASDVLVLTEENFASTLAAEPTILVEFYAPWCTHCKQLAPKYETVATTLKDLVKIAKVDCTAETEVCKEQDVRGYPTIKLFKHGQDPVDYAGQREAADLIAYMKKAVRPLVNIVDSASAAALIADEPVTVLAYVNEGDDTSTATFAGVAAIYADKVTFAQTSDAALASANGAQFPSISVHKDGSVVVLEAGAAFDAKTLEDFITEHSIPVMEELGPSNYKDYISSGLPLAIFILGEPADRTAHGPAVEAYAKSQRGKMNFVYLDGQKYAGFADTLNLRQEFPAFGIQTTKGSSAKYPLNQDEEFSVERLIALADAVLAGTAEPSLKSEPIPASQTGPVTVVVGKTYNSIVNELGKDVLIEFYAPWCGHCKNLAPTYDKLGEHYANNPNIVIAKMDVTANDLPLGTPFEVEGFPTIKLVTADNTVVAYEGNRDFDSFVDFITENASAADSTEGTKAADGHEEL